MQKNVHDLIIIGAGAAGLMAAAEASRSGLDVLVLEGQREPGLKILISGGGRCNVTNARLSEKDYSSGCAHTLRHVLKTFTPAQAVDFFERWGAPLALQGTGEFFSADDKARTVRDALVRAAEEGGTRVACGWRVNSLAVQDGAFNVIGQELIECARAVLVTTGGLSYPATGSDGAGYSLAAMFGHKIVPTRPALTPFIASEDIFSNLTGIVVPVRLSLWAEGRKLRSVEGPLLFTHNGFSGPAPMEMSGHWLAFKDKPGCGVSVDFMPEMKGDGIEFLFDPSSAKRSVKNVVARFLPERLAAVLIESAGLDTRLFSGELGQKDKKALAGLLRGCVLPIQGTMGYDKAEVTGGGVDLKELKGATLESRLQEGLYFAGEVVDVDGRIGGFNLHWAWASAVAAARAIAKKVKT
jgi:predicted Rossmann fold flavoprotein